METKMLTARLTTSKQNKIAKTKKQTYEATPKTKVLFLMEEDKNVLAVFPLEKEYPKSRLAQVNALPQTKKDLGKLVACYSHVGQHSSCHPDYYNELPKASPVQYANLKSELVNIGYNLDILNEN